MQMKKWLDFKTTVLLREKSKDKLSKENLKLMENSEQIVDLLHKNFIQIWTH